MNKPLGYYTNYTPGNGSILEVIESKYGAYLQNLNQREKRFFLKRCIWILNHESPEETSRVDELNELFQRLTVLPQSDIIGIIRCLAEGLSS